MTADEAKATSFGSVADRYDQVRPWPAAAAVDWLVPAGCEVAVDLAAGTGLFTRALLGHAERVVAVEPDERMREVLASRSPAVDVLAGSGEAMPLPDASADAVFVSTAWHWLDLPRAVPEIARVLRPGGRLGVIWTSRDRDEDWVAELDLLGPGAGGDARANAGGDAHANAGGADAGGRGGPRTLAEARADLDRHHEVRLPAGSAFGPGETASFRYTRAMPVADVLAWLATNSDFITAPATEREAALTRYGHAVRSRAGGRPVLAVPIRSWCWRADRR